MKKHPTKLFVVAFSLLLIAGCGKEDINEIIPPAPDEGSEIIRDTVKTDWTLVFEENFDSTAVNTAEWSMYNGAGHVNNGLRRPEAFTVEDGLLVVTAQMKDGALVSGGMAHRRSYDYARFEFRVRTEADPSAAVSGVVLTWPTNESFPLGGEIDIYETLTYASRDHFYTYIHYSKDNNTVNHVHYVDAKEWHTMMCEWLPSAIRIFRDGELVYTESRKEVIPKVDHHLCIQLDAFKTTMGEPVHMYVDWVKIYR
jgi:hypothetical protein